MISGGGVLGLTFWVWLSECELGGRSPMWCFVRMPRSEGTVCNVPRRPLRSSRKPRVFVNGGAFGREHADEVARLGALSLLEVILATTQRNKMVLALLGASGGFRRGLDSVGPVPGSTAKACAPAGLLCELPALKQRRLKSAWEPFAVSLQQGATTVSEGNFKFKEAIHCSPCCRGNDWAWSPLPEPHGQHVQPCLPSIVVAHAATTCSACVAVQLLCVSAPTCRGFFGTWRPGVIPRTKGLNGPLVLVVLMRSSAQPLAPQHVCGAVGVQVRVNPELADPGSSRRARAVLDPWLSAPTGRRGAQVAPGAI